MVLGQPRTIGIAITIEVNQFNTFDVNKSSPAHVFTVVSRLFILHIVPVFGACLMGHSKRTTTSTLLQDGGNTFVDILAFVCDKNTAIHLVLVTKHKSCNSYIISRPPMFSLGHSKPTEVNKNVIAKVYAFVQAQAFAHADDDIAC